MIKQRQKRKRKDQSDSADGAPTSTTRRGSKKAEPSVSVEVDSEIKPMVFKPRVDPQDRTKALSTMVQNVRKSIEVLHERSKKRPVKLFTPAMLRRNLLQYDEIQFQHMLSSVGFRYPCAIELVAPAHVGSTTFVFDWISRLLDVNCYSIYCECENKQMNTNHILRIMDRDPAVAALKLHAIEFTSSRSLAQLDETLRQTVSDLRKRCDADPETKGNPIFFFVDHWSALMSKSEAKGNTDWGLAANAPKEGPKDTTDGSNFEHAKHSHGMSRWLPTFMETYNCTVVFLQKQRDKIEMNARPSYMAPSPLKNDTRIGGQAFRAVCAYRMTMMKLGEIRSKTGDKKEYGHHVRIMLVKNSYGVQLRTCDATVYFDEYADTATYKSPAFSYDDRTAAWFATRKLLGTTVEKDLYTCDALGCVAVSAQEFMLALKSNPTQLEYVGSQLDIEGYSRSVTDIAPREEDGTEVDNDPDDMVNEEPDTSEPDTVPE